MLIDENRLNDFLEKHYCDVDRKAKTFEDAFIYVNHNTNKWESVLEQLKTDIELEEKWDELEDVLFVENDNGDLVLHEDWDKYKAGTLREDIWEDMFEKYSDGAELVAHPIYDDYGQTIKIPDAIRDMFVNKEIAIEVKNQKEQISLLKALKRIGAVTDEMEYDPRYPYYFMDKNEYLNANVNMENIVKQEGIRQLVDFKNFNDIQKVTEDKQQTKLKNNMEIDK